MNQEVEMNWFASAGAGLSVNANGDAVGDSEPDTWFATQREAEEAMALYMSKDLEDRR